jgi:hypothetical protein
MWTKKKPKGSKVVPIEDNQKKKPQGVPRGYDKVQMFTEDGRPEGEDDEDDDDDDEP